MGSERTKTYVRHHQNPAEPRHQGDAQSGPSAGQSANAVAARWNSTSTTREPAAMGAGMSRPTPNCSANGAMCKRRRMVTTIGCNEGKRSDGKLSRFVWGEG